MMTYQPAVDNCAYERILGAAMVDVASELRLADPIELVSMIRGDQDANIADLVSSSSELFFKSGSLRYALASGCELRWGSTPTFRLDLEFRHAAVTVFFRLTIGGERAGVEVIDIFIDDDDSGDPAQSAVRLSQAIADARLV